MSQLLNAEVNVFPWQPWTSRASRSQSQNSFWQNKKSDPGSGCLPSWWWAGALRCTCRSTSSPCVSACTHKWSLNIWGVIPHGEDFTRLTGYRRNTDCVQNHPLIHNILLTIEGILYREPYRELTKLHHYWGINKTCQEVDIFVFRPYYDECISTA